MQLHGGEWTDGSVGGTFSNMEIGDEALEMAMRKTSEVDNRDAGRSGVVIVVGSLAAWPVSVSGSTVGGTRMGVQRKMESVRHWATAGASDRPITAHPNSG